MNSTNSHQPAFALRGVIAACLIALLAGCAATGSGPDATSQTAPASADTPRTAAPAPVAQDPHAQLPGRAPTARLRTSVPDPAEQLPANELTSQILFQVLASEVAAQRGQIASATATYLSLARQTRDPRFARRATELALAERSLDRALEAARVWHEYSPASPLASQTLEALLLTTGKLDEAQPLVSARLAKARAENGLSGFYQQLQRTLSRVADRQGALALFDRISTEDAQLPEARLAAAELASAAGHKERAAAEAARALELRPDDENAAVRAARFLQDTPAGTAGALRLLADFLERQPRSTEARFHYARLLASSGDTDSARRQMEIALRDEPESPPILFSLAQIAYQTRQVDVAEDYLKRYLALPRGVPRDDGPAYLFLGQIEEERGRLPQAIEWLEKVTRGEQFLPALLRRSLLLGRTGQVDEARELLRNTSVPTNRERAQLVAAEAQVLRQARRHQEAFDVLEAALERMPGNPELLYDHAMAAEKVDRLPAMEASLRKLIELRPDSAHAYNALGYTFADRNIRLEEAQALIEKALELAPEDAHILDSMGWVLYRRGNFERAAEYLQRAFKLRPEAEIAAHLGEVLWRLGRTAEARQLWRDARVREPDNEVLRETLARLNVSL